MSDGANRFNWVSKLRPRALRQAPRVLLLRVAWQVHPGLCVASLVSMCVSAFLPLAFTVASGALVGAVPGTTANGWASPAGADLRRALITIGVVFVVQLGLLPYLHIAVMMLARRLNIELSSRTMAAVLGPPGISHLEDSKTQDDIAKAEGAFGAGGGTPPGQAIAGLVSIWTTRLTGIGGFLIVARFRWWLAVALLVITTIDRAFWLKLYDRVTTAVFNRGEIHRRSSWYRDAAVTPVPAKEVRLFGLADWLMQRQHDTWAEAMDPVWPQMKGRPFLSSLLLMRTPLVVVAALAVLFSAAMDNEVSVGQLVVIAQGFLQILSVGSSGDSDYTVSQAVACVPVALDLEQKLGSPEFMLGGTGPAAGLPTDRIVFEGVRFGYPGRPRAVFESLTLDIPAGRSLAIVGANGSGKTTLVKLLARLYDPDGGRITVDGVDLRELDPRAWQRRIAAIFQDFQHYALSARDNVAWGAPHVDPDNELLDRVARRAGAAGVVGNLTAGWDTPLSRQLKGGTDLSGGEWQRLALARALFAVEGGASMLILDEPSANLDARAEAELYDRFLDVTAGLTTIVISHRFSTVRRADEIVVLEEGRVVERGDHNALVARGGRYAEMFRLQASRYADDDDETPPEPVEAAGA